jgi:Tol biopolymer transport system component
MFSVAVDPAASPNWDVARDGSAVALVGLDEARDRIRLVDVQTGSARSIPVANSRELTGISWSADGKSWVITNSSVRGAAVLRVILNGTVFELWATTNNLATPLLSPDGKNLAFTVSSRNSNAWMIENF